MNGDDMTKAEPKPKRAKKDQKLDLAGPTAQALLRKMTNWQITQWQKAGRPNTYGEMVRYTELVHWKQRKGIAHGNKSHTG